MADKIVQIAEANQETRALIEEGLREQYQADNRQIPQNFVDIVNTLTALATEYGVKNLSGKKLDTLCFFANGIDRKIINF